MCAAVAASDRGGDSGPSPAERGSLQDVKKSTTRRPHADPPDDDACPDPRPRLPPRPDRAARPPQLPGGDGDWPPLPLYELARSRDHRRLRAEDASEPDDPKGVSRAHTGDEGGPDRVFLGGTAAAGVAAAAAEGEAAPDRMAPTSAGKSEGGIGAGGGRSRASVWIMISASPGTCVAPRLHISKS